jgi:hypothetical protein
MSHIQERDCLLLSSGSNVHLQAELSPLEAQTIDRDVKKRCVRAYDWYMTLPCLVAPGERYSLCWEVSSVSMLGGVAFCAYGVSTVSSVFRRVFVCDSDVK